MYSVLYSAGKERKKKREEALLVVLKVGGGGIYNSSRGKKYSLFIIGVCVVVAIDCLGKRAMKLLDERVVVLLGTCEVGSDESNIQKHVVFRDKKKKKKQRYSIYLVHFFSFNSEEE